MKRLKLVRITTVDSSLKILLKGQIEFMSNHFDVHVISNPGEYLNYYKKLNNINVWELRMVRKPALIKDIISLIKLIQIIHKIKPDIVHTHTPKAGLLGILAAFICRVPVRLHTVAGMPLMEIKGYKKKLYIFVEKITYFFSTKIYPNSYGLKQYIETEKITNTSKLKVLGFGSSNGIDLNFFDKKKVDSSKVAKIKEELDLDDFFVFLYVGRIVGDKGINELITAFKTINKYHKTKLLLVGNYEEDLDPLNEETLLEINKNSNIMNLGWQDDVRLFFLLSKCMVFPSYREGFPNVVLQSSAMETPSIVTDINGSNEIIIHEYNGLIVPKKNIEKLVFEMNRIITDKNLYSKLKKNSKKLIKDRFDQEILWKILLEEYLSINKMI